MATYEWDLGFDFDSLQDSSGQFYVQNGFVTTSADGTSNPGTPFGLSTGDTISFKVFNLTSGAIVDDFSITSGKIIFRKAMAEDTQAPFNDLPLIASPLDNGEPKPTIELSLLDVTNVGHEVSAVFSGGQGVKYQVWAVAIPQRVAYEGKFFFTVTMNVQRVGDPLSPRTFHVDPEMVVGSLSGN